LPCTAAAWTATGCGAHTARHAQDFDTPDWYFGYSGNARHRHRACHRRTADRYEFPNGDYILISIDVNIGGTYLWCARAAMCPPFPCASACSRRSRAASEACMHRCTPNPSHAARFNSFLGGPYYHGWYGYNGTPRTALTLVVVIDFDTAVVDNNRAGRGGVSPQALTVLRTRGVAVNNDNNPITAVFAPPAKPLANNNALPPASALAPAGAAAQPPSGGSNSSAPPPASADAPAANSSTARAPGSPDAPAPASPNAPAPTSPNAPAPSDDASDAPPTTAGPVRGALQQAGVIGASPFCLEPGSALRSSPRRAASHGRRPAHRRGGAPHMLAAAGLLLSHAHQTGP